MTTKTDFQEIAALQASYEPKHRGVVTEDEAKKIKDILELENRSEIELHNVRDMVVMLYDQRVDSAREAGDMVEFDKLRDAMSAIVSIIDGEMFDKGIEV